jgi:hypothetical protein
MSETQSYKTVAVTVDERMALMSCILARMIEFKRFIESSQGYFDSLAGATDELHVGYRESTGKYLASLREENGCLQSFYDKLMGGAE